MLILDNSIRDILFLLYGLLVCIIILCQGQHYWKLKLYQLTSKEFNQIKNLSFFKKAKILNIYLILLMPFALALQYYLSGWQIKSKNLMALAIMANLFAILEHVNYYNKQLMIDKKSDLIYLIRNKKLKTASLAKDIMEGKF